MQGNIRHKLILSNWTPRWLDERRNFGVGCGERA
jgi:hypothetical protein